MTSMSRLTARLGGAFLAVAVVASCNDTSQLLEPGPHGERRSPVPDSCVIRDNPEAQERTVTTACLNSEVMVPEGWTLRVVGDSPSAPIVPGAVGPMQLTQIPNPDADYVDATDLIDISGIADFTILTSVTDGVQTASFDITMEKRSVPASWFTWSCPPFSETCTPHILFTQGEMELTIDLSVPSGIFGFELNPNPFAVHTYTAEFFSGGELVGSITRSVDGDAGARLFAAESQAGDFDQVVVTGTADFAIANLRYGEAEPAICVPVEIDNAYSGLPAQDPGVISLQDDWVFVEILNVEEFLGRPASADQVRIGDDWETGTPAESFEILDINMDGNLDIRLRWSVDQLVADGNLSTATEELEVWGLDMTDGQLYCGSHPVRVIDDDPPPGACTWDNGGFVTHPGAGAGGADVSMASVIGGISTAGSNVRLQPGGPHFRIADDFTVDATCVLTEVITHGYESFSAIPTWTQANMNIRSGSEVGPIVASATTTSWDWSGVYRVFNGLANLGNTDRPVHRVTFEFDNLELDPGTYWIDWQVEGGSSGWSNYRMEPDPVPGGINTITVFDNGRQMTVGGVWQPILADPGAETPFLVRGPGAPPLQTHGTPRVSPDGELPRGYELQPEDRAQPSR